MGTDLWLDCFHFPGPDGRECLGLLLREVDHPTNHSKIEAGLHYSSLVPSEFVIAFQGEHEYSIRGPAHLLAVLEGKKLDDFERRRLRLEIDP